MHQLTPSEAALLAVESNTNLGHQSLALDLGANADGDNLSIAQLRALVADNIHHVPALRRRIRQVPLELDDPWWIEDPHFDLEYHIRHLAVPGSSDPDALEQLLARLHERPLDRNRPMWELYLIENPDCTSTLFVKVHIVLIEELGPLGPLSPLLARDVDEYGVPADRSWRPDMMPTDSDLLIKAAWSTMRSPIRFSRHLLEASSQVPVIGEVARLALAFSNRDLHPVEKARNDRPVPRVSINRTVGKHRRVARVTLSVDRLREIRRARDVRFHDVLLAVISGSLRHWLVINDQLPPEPLVALTPLLVDADSDELGAALVPIATQRHDPVQRLDDIAASMSELTLELEPQSAKSISARDGAPSTLAGTASRLLMTTGAGLRMMPPFNVYVVNIPGRAEGLIGGHEILREHAMVPIVDGVGLSISAISHDDRVDITLVGDRDLVPDLDVLAERLDEEVDLLIEALTPKRKPRATTKRPSKRAAKSKRAAASKAS